MDKGVIDQFWTNRSTQGSGRWTDPRMLEFELAMLSPIASRAGRILDLGSGPAVLSQHLLHDATTLTAVDRYPAFLDQIPDVSCIHKICDDVVRFDYPEHYDLILLFGVVTHLDPEEELAVYAKAARGLLPAGVLAVKNQVARGAEKQVDGYSEALGCRYVGRYPGVQEQAGRLARHFRRVEPVWYPTEFDAWPDTTHVCFLCSDSSSANL